MGDKNVLKMRAFKFIVREATNANGKALSSEEITEAIMRLHPRPYAKPSFLEEGSKSEIEVVEDWKQQLPNWLEERIGRYRETWHTANIVANVASQQVSEGLITADKEFIETAWRVLEALHDNPSPATEKCLEMLIRKAGWDLHVALRDNLAAWRREYKASQKGIRRGHAAYGDDSWLVELDRRPEWMEHKVKANGKTDWKISDRIILQELNNNRDVIAPGSHTTIGRMRNKRRLALKQPLPQLVQ